MAINVDLNETKDPSKVGEFERVAPGPVHLMVSSIQENGGKNGEHVVKFEVLMHPQQSEIGATHTEYFPADARMAWKLLTFCYAVKIADREAMARAKEAGNQYVPIELKDAEGRQLFGTIKVTEKDGKSFHNLDSMLAIDDPKAEKHPRNVGMLKQAMAAYGSAAAATKPATTQPATQPQRAQSTATAADPFAAVT